MEAKTSVLTSENTLTNILTHPYTSFTLRLILGLVFIYAGSIKIGDMPNMAQSIENYRLVPVVTTNILGIILPPIELLAGICLIVGLFYEGALTILTTLLIVFVIAVQSAIFRGLDIECGCFSTSDAEIVGIKVLLRDILLLLAVIPLWLSKNHIFHFDQWFRNKRQSQD